MNVFIITGSENQWAIEEWVREIEARGSRANVIPAKDWRSVLLHPYDDTTFLIDAVNPAEFQDNQRLVRCLLSSGRRCDREQRRVVVLAAEWQFDQLVYLESIGLWVHSSAEGMKECFDYLAGKVRVYEMHHDDAHEQAVFRSRPPRWW